MIATDRRPMSQDFLKGLAIAAAMYGILLLMSILVSQL